MASITLIQWNSLVILGNVLFFYISSLLCYEQLARTVAGRPARSQGVVNCENHHCVQLVAGREALDHFAHRRLAPLVN